MDTFSESHQNEEIELVPFALTTNKSTPTYGLALPIGSSSEGLNNADPTVYGYSSSTINQL